MSRSVPEKGVPRSKPVPSVTPPATAFTPARLSPPSRPRRLRPLARRLRARDPRLSEVAPLGVFWRLWGCFCASHAPFRLFQGVLLYVYSLSVLPFSLSYVGG